MKRLAQILAFLPVYLVACENDAITFAHQIDPTAECHADCTYSGCEHINTAYCRIGSNVYYCTSGKGPYLPQCKLVVLEQK